MLSLLWEWRSLIGWAVMLAAVLMILGFARPVVEAVTETWKRVALPILEYLAKNPAARAAVIGIAFFGLLALVWGLASERGYKTAKGECNAAIAERERDAAVKERNELKKQLDALEVIRMNDRRRAELDAQERERQKDNRDAFRKLTGPCFDADTVRRLWGR